MLKTSKFYKDVKRVVTIAIVVCFSLLIFMGFIMNFNKIVNKHNELNVSAAYDFSDTSSVELNPSDSNYKNNSEFKIWSKKGLEKLSASVYNGCTFAGKTVNLTGDIDLYDRENGTSGKFNGIGSGGAIKGDPMGDFEYYKPFCGEFNGNGYTISNFFISHNTKMIPHKDGDFNGSGSQRASGLFCCLSDDACVYDLKLDNVLDLLDASTPQVNYWEFNVGAVCGFVDNNSNVRIENCEVSNFTVELLPNEFNSNATINAGGIIGYIPHGSVIVVKNCKVSNLRFDFSWLKRVSKWTGIVCGFLCETRVVSNIIFESKGSYIKTTSTYKFEGLNGYYGDSYIANYGKDNYTNYIEEDTSTNPYKNLGWSSEGGTINEVSKYWYFSSDYAAYPILRTFLKDWKTVTFTSNPEKSATFNETSIKIPSDANKTYTSSGVAISIYNVEITATAEPGYRILGWKCNSATSYTVNCELIPFKLTFTNASSFATMKVDGTIKTSDTMELNYGSVVNFSYEKNNGIFTYTYEISNAGNVLKTVTYTTKSNKYTMGIDNNKNLINGLNGSNTYEIVFSDGVTSKTIVPNFVLKNYDFILK